MINFACEIGKNSCGSSNDNTALIVTLIVAGIALVGCIACFIIRAYKKRQEKNGK